MGLAVSPETSDSEKGSWKRKMPEATGADLRERPPWGKGLQGRHNLGPARGGGPSGLEETFELREPPEVAWTDSSPVGSETLHFCSHWGPGTLMSEIVRVLSHCGCAHELPAMGGVQAGRAAYCRANKSQSCVRQPCSAALKPYNAKIQGF